jgi:hypothetical protein
MGNYDPILMKFDAETKKNMLDSKFRKAGMIDCSKMAAAAAMLELQVNAIKWAFTTRF